MWQSTVQAVLRSNRQLSAFHGLSKQYQRKPPIIAQKLLVNRSYQSSPTSAFLRGNCLPKFSTASSCISACSGLVVRNHAAQCPLTPVAVRKLSLSAAFCTVIRPAVTIIDHVSEPPRQNDTTDIKEQAETEDPWLLRHTVVTTNVGRSPKRPQGVAFNVGYMDSGADWHETKKATTPTILAIPGQPGCHDDLLPVVKPLHEDGHRVVIVNMPGYEYTKSLTQEDTEHYQNSSAELAEFVYHFIGALQLERIDLVVTHSAGSIPLLVLAGRSDSIKGAMIICTPSGHVPSRVNRPLWFIKGLVIAWETYIGRALVKAILPLFNKVVKWLNTDDPTQLMMTAKFGAYNNFDLMKRVSLELDGDKTPFVYIASKNDRLVEMNLSLEWAKMLGASEEAFDVYDENYDLAKLAEREKSYPKGVLLTKGGHYPQRKEAALPILISEARELIAFVTRNE